MIYRREETAVGPRNAQKEGEILCTWHSLDTQLLLVKVSVYLHSSESLTHLVLFYCDSLPGDVLAGVTVASMLIPQSVSYASSLAKMSPVTGLVCPAPIPGL
jgi:hypothetical protein